MREVARACRCTGWKSLEGGSRAEKRCGPRTARGHRPFWGVVAFYNGIPGREWFRPTVSVRNDQGFITSTVRGSLVLGMAAAKKVADDMLADECLMRGFGGR